MPSAATEILESARLDRLLRDQMNMPWLSGQAWDALFDLGCIQTGEGKKCKAGDKLPIGAKVVLHIPEPGIGIHCAEPAAEPVFLAADQSWGIFQKNSGEAIYPLLPWETNTFLNRVMGFLENSALISEPNFRDLASPPILEGGLAQRLDTDTSGLVLVVFTKERKNEIRALIQRQQLEKTYHAIIGGQWDKERTLSGQIDHFAQKQMRMVESGGQAVSAVVSALARGPKHSLISVRTCQGARHIVRVLLASAGNPLLGDALYGGDTKSSQQHQLHAAGIRLLSPHPHFPNLNHSAPAPAKFCSLLADLGIQYQYE